MRKQRHDIYIECPVEATLDVIGGKWKGVLLFRLLSGVKRFNEFRRLLPKITQRMLTNQLRELERDGLISRKIYAEIPPRVEYRLTKLGKALAPALTEMQVWGANYILPGRSAGGGSNVAGGGREHKTPS